MNALRAVPTTFPIVRNIDDAKAKTNAALAAQYKVGWRAGWNAAWLWIGAACMCSFVGGAVFAAGITALVSAVLP